MKKLVPVIFRAFKDGQVIALFPSISATRDDRQCQSYMTIGQHGAADIDIVRTTRPIKRGEHLQLVGELRKIGYKDLLMVKRITKVHTAQRRASILCGA